MTDTLSPDQELDLTSAGFQAERGNFEIVGASYQPTKAGTGTMLVVETKSVSNLSGKDRQTEVKLRFNVRNQNPKAQEIGESEAKRLFVAVLGAPKGSPSALVGRIFSAEAYEDDRGFIALRKYQPQAA